MNDLACRLAECEDFACSNIRFSMEMSDYSGRLVTESVSEKMGDQSMTFEAEVSYEITQL
jgi:hypothetical protein